MNGMLSIRSLSHAIGIADTTISNYLLLTPEKLPPAQKVGKHYVFSLEDTMTWAREREVARQYGFTPEEAAEYLGFLSWKSIQRVFARTGWAPRRYYFGTEAYYFQANLDMWAEKVGMTKGWRRPFSYNIRPGYTAKES